jgi:hypothetical protein
MTKFVFIAVIAVLAFALYSIPSHSKDEGATAPGAKPMQNSNGQIQDQRKPDRARTAQRKPGERTKIQTPPEPPKPEVK